VHHHLENFVQRTSADEAHPAGMERRWLTKEVPLMVTENHLANELTGPMTTIFAALWLADNVGSFFEGGGAAFYHSPIQPQGIQNSCLGWPRGRILSLT
jgi:hypothetical protein